MGVEGDAGPRPVAGSRRARIVRWLALVVCAVALANCGKTASGAKSAVSAFASFGSGPEPPTLPKNSEPEIRCPPVRILAGTESLRREDGSGTPQGLRWQASIAKTARECTASGDGVAMRVGVSGRVVTGPKGASGTISLPVRVAVRETSGVTYDKVQTATVTLDAPSKDWALVDEMVTVGAGPGSVVYVGFIDE